MKYLQFALLPFLMSAPLVIAAPSWYEDRSLPVADNELVGYGAGKTEHKAKLSAAQDVAFQFGLDIEVNTTKSTRVVNDKYKLRFTEDIKQKTRHKLNNLNIIKSEEDDLWYVAVKASAVPHWFSARLYKAGPDQTVGYGQGKTAYDAQVNAAKNIALQMGLKIKVHTVSKSELKNKKFDQNFAENIQVKSEHDLGKVRLLNNQKIKGHWYAAAEIGDNRHFASKLIDKLSKQADVCQSSSSSLYLKSLMSFKQLISELGCVPPVKLMRRNNSWQVGSAGITQRITENEFREFITPTSTAGLQISTDKSTVYEEDAYTLFISSAETGYLSGFIVYEDGHVALLFDNIKVDAGQNLAFPDPNSGLELVAELPRRGIKTTDLYIVVRTDRPAQFSEFEEMTDSIQKADEDIKFGELIDKITTPFASTLIHTLPLSRKFR